MPRTARRSVGKRTARQSPLGGVAPSAHPSPRSLSSSGAARAQSLAASSSRRSVGIWTQHRAAAVHATRCHGPGGRHSSPPACALRFALTYNPTSAGATLPTVIPGSVQSRRLNWVEAESVPTLDAVVLIPLGATAKRHGPHLRLNGDWAIAGYFRNRACRPTRWLHAQRGATRGERHRCRNVALAW